MAISIVKKSSFSNLLSRIYGNMDLDEKVREDVENFLKKTLKVSTVSKLKTCEYFFVYKKNDVNNPTISALFIRRNSFLVFLNITKQEMLNEGLHPNEFKEYLTSIGAVKFSNIKEVFVNI